MNEIARLTLEVEQLVDNAKQDLYKIQQLEEESKEQEQIYLDLQKFAVESERENVKLKQQLSEIKYLNYDEIAHAIIPTDTIEEAINNILKLAIPNQQKLNRQEVEKVVYEHISWRDDKLVTAICKLSLPETWEISACLYKTPEIEGIKRDRIKEMFMNFARYGEPVGSIAYAYTDSLIKILAITNIDKDKIIQIFAKYACFCGLDNDFGEVKISADEFYELITDEIIKEINGR